MAESGAIDVFIFGSTAKNLETRTPPKVVLTKLSQITGFAPLPPINSLGFHFSKWAEISSTTITNWDRDFTSYKFPVDVFWMDIPHTANFKYFIYNTIKFNLDAV